MGWIKYLLFAGLFVVALIVKAYEKSKGEDAAIEVARLWRNGETERAFSVCEQGFNKPQFSKSAKRKLAHFFCENLAETGNPRYERGLQFLKPEDALVFQIVYHRRIGNYPRMEALARELLSISKKKRFLRFAYEIIGDSFVYRCMSLQAFKEYMTGVNALNKKAKESLAVRAYKRAQHVFANEHAAQAYALIGNGCRKKLALLHDEYEGKRAKLKKLGVKDDYFLRLEESLEEKKRNAYLFYTIPMSPTDRTNYFAKEASYFAGATAFDTPTLKERKWTFIAQIDFTSFPEAYQKPYALRFWINLEGNLYFLKEGVYKCDFEDLQQTENDIDKAPLNEAKVLTKEKDGEPNLSIATVVKSKPQKFDPKRAEAFSYNLLSGPSLLLPMPCTMTPNGFSTYATDFCEKNELPSPISVAEEIKDLSSRVGRNYLRSCCGYPLLYKNSALKEGKKDFCLAQFDITYLEGKKLYSFCMNEEDFLNDDFSDIIVIRQDVV